MYLPRFVALFRFMVCIWLGWFFGLGSVARAQAPEPSATDTPTQARSSDATRPNWDVGIIHVDEENHGKQIPSSYWPIELSELNDRLEKIRAQRLQRELSPPGIEEAIYVATLNRDALISEQSRWQFRANHSVSSEPIRVGRVSFAMRDARHLSETAVQLSTDHRFLADGSIELPSEARGTARWFGFQCAAVAIDGTRRFSIGIPPATLGRMLISAEPGLALTSTDVVIERIENPIDYLPSDWSPIDFGSGTMENRNQWWLVHLSGALEFTFDVDVDSNAPSRGPQHTLRHAELEYVLDQKLVTLTASFEFAPQGASPAIQLRLDPRLRIKSAMGAGQTMPWKIVALSDDATLVELVTKNAPAFTQFEVQATAHPRPLGESNADMRASPEATFNSAVAETKLDGVENGANAPFTLPGIEVEHGVVMQGLTRVLGNDRASIRIIDSIESFRPNVSAATTGQVADGSVEWQAHWLGRQPNIQVQMADFQESLSSEGLTRFIVRPKSISAIANVRIYGEQLRSNSLAIPICNDWIIDSVQLPNDAANHFRVGLEKSPDGAIHLVLRWQQAMTDIQTDLLVTAHSTVESDGPRFALNHPQILQFSNGLHRNIYKFDETTGCRPRFTPRLLQMLVSEREIPASLQSMSNQPTSNGALYYSDLSDGQGVFEFEIVQGTYSADCWTVLRQDESQRWTSESRLTIQPKSGSIDRIRVRLSGESDFNQWQFDYVGTDGTPVRLMALPVGAQESNDGANKIAASSLPTRLPITEVELLLPTATSEKFELRAYLPVISLESPSVVDSAIHSNQLSIGDNYDLPFLKLSTLGLATDDEVTYTLLFPKQLSLIQSNMPIELLPSETCCHPTLAAQLATLLDDRELVDYVTARMNGAEPWQVAFQATNRPPHDTWIWRETLEHQIDDSNDLFHRADLDVQTVRNGALIVRYPSDWHLTRVRIGARDVTPVANADHSVEIPIGSNQRVRVQIDWTSKAAPYRWFAKVHVARPSYDVPLLQHSESVLLAPKLLSLEAIADCMKRNATSNSSQSLRKLANNIELPHPWAWWRWITPGGVNAGTSSDPSNWTRFQIGTLVQDDSQRDSASDDGENGFSRNTRRTPNGVKAFYIVDRNALAAMLAAVAIAITSISWMLLRRQVGIWFISVGMIALTRVVLSGHPAIGTIVAMLSEVALLSAGLGAIARVIERIVFRPTVIRNQALRSQSSVASTATMLGLVFCCILFSSDANAQVLSNPSAQSVVAKDLSTPQIFGVFIPSDQENKPVGQYAYIPKQLRDLLYANDISTNDLNGSYILSANYQLKLRQNQRDVDPVQECVVQMRILVVDAEAELLLPIFGEGLEWISTPQLNGQPRFLHGRNFRLAPDGNGILFRSDMQGTVNVTLHFRPKVRVTSDNQYEMDVAIPPIPNATLRISPNGQATNIDVRSQGTVQRTFLGDTIAHLGPLDRLKVKWNEMDRNANGLAAEQTSETWVHAQGDRFIVACQLKIERGRSLARELDLSLDANWEPVGTQWGDAQPVASTASNSFRGRNVVRIRLADPQGPDNIIRMLLVPKSGLPPDNFEVPMISLDRIPTKSKYFWWSSEKEALWSADVLDSRLVQVDNATQWGTWALAPVRSVYQILNSPIRLRRQPGSPTAITYTDRTTLRIYSNRTALDYETTWDSTLGTPEQLQIFIPSEHSQLRLEMNGLPARFQLGDDGQLMMISMKDNGIGRLGRLRLNMELPVLAGKKETLPRVRIHPQIPSQSVYQLVRGADTDVHALPTVDSISILPAASNQNLTQQLDNLVWTVGEFNVPVELLDKTELPVAIEVKPAPPNPPRYVWMTVDWMDDGWRASVHCRWKSDASNFDFAFFDLPLNSRDSLTAGSLPFKFMPHSNPDRTNLCIPIPEADANGTRELEFSFKFAGSPSPHAIALPDVIVLQSTVEPFVALPVRVAGKKVHWLNVEPVTEPASLDLAGLPVDDRYQLSRLPKNQHQVSWQADEQTHDLSQLALTLVDLTSTSDAMVSGTVSYWLDPKGQFNQLFDIPDHCEILSVECHGQPAVWSYASSRLRVALQPSYMPVQVRIMASWKMDAEQTLLRIPQAICETQPDHVYVNFHENSAWQLSPSGDSVPQVENRSALIDRWAELVSTAIPELPNYSEAEFATWKAQWRPELFGFSNNTPILAPTLQVIFSDSDLNDDGEITVGELWNRVDHLSLSVESSVDAVASARGAQQDNLWKVQGSELVFSRAAPGTDSLARTTFTTAWAIAAFIALATGGVFATGWLRGFSLKSEWALWLALAGLAWIFLPIVWFSIAALVIGVWQALSQFLPRRARFGNTA